MDSFDFKKLKPTNFPDGAYIIILAAATPTDGVLLSHMKVVVGWPNPVLTTLQALQEPPQQLLETVNRFLQGPYNKSLFNMAIYEVEDAPHGAAIFGPLTPTIISQDQIASIFNNVETHLVIK